MHRRLAAALLALISVVPVVRGAAAGDDERSFLWRVTRGPRSVYLLGSIHFMRQDAYPLSPAIEAAYQRSGVVVFETDIEGLDRAALALLAAGSLEDGVSLEEVVPEELSRQVMERLEALGMSGNAFDGMKPWMVALSLSSLELMRAGYLGERGIDATFSARAEADGKRIQSLESIEYQVSLFADLSEEEGVDFLRYSLDELETAIPMVDELVVAWKSGDAARLEALIVGGFEEHPELFRRLVTDRNRRWFPELEALLGGNTDALVVVGALHLVGRQGLVKLFEEAGYGVEQL